MNDMSSAIRLRM